MSGIKIIFLGELGVGKSSILQMLNKEKFTHVYDGTIGADLRLIKTKKYKLSFWEISGSEKYAGMIDGFVNTADIVFFCYASNDENSYKRILEKYEKYRNLSCRKILLETKIDLQETETEGMEFAKKEGIDFIRTSALMGIGRAEIITAVLKSEEVEAVEQTRSKTPKITCIIS
jgi:small GTP-binding protein